MPERVTVVEHDGTVFEIRPGTAKVNNDSLFVEEDEFESFSIRQPEAVVVTPSASDDREETFSGSVYHVEQTYACYRLDFTT